MTAPPIPPPEEDELLLEEEEFAGPPIPEQLYEEYPTLADGIENERAQLPQTEFSVEIFERETTAPANVEEETDVRTEVGAGDPNDPVAKRAMEALYGPEFPLLQTEPNGASWGTWAQALWDRHREGVQTRLHLVERNRLMRGGTQWLSSQGMGPWREPPKPKDSTRAVDNVIKPALDQRLQIISEQRPGFRTRPETQDAKNLKKAEAQQIALEYQFTQQAMTKILREAEYWAGTDGVSFMHLYWNPDRGPWDEVMVPRVTESGEELYEPETKPLGDIEPCVLRIEQVRVSAEATATKPPSYWVIRQTIPTAQAVAEYGADVLENIEEGDGRGDTDALDSGQTLRLGLDAANPDVLYRDQPTVNRFTIYCEKSEFLKEGLTMVVVGRKLVAGPLPLLFGTVPVIRVTDGSSDPNFYPAPIMDDWIDSQMRINVLKSKWIDSIRVNSGGRFLGKENALAQETLVGGLTSFISIKGAGPIDDNVKAMQGFSVGNDVKELLEIERKAFEDRSGWNDTSRGSFSADQSGRAILAIREQLERTFAPPVNAAAEAMTRWAEVTLAIMRWGYDYPRTLSVEGTGRPDLARAISAQDLDGVANVSIDPETLMPMPRALRLFILDGLLQKGAITMEDYKRRLPFAFTRQIDSPDFDQSSRAARVVQAIRDTGDPNALPMLWQDDEAIHQDALERELILPDEFPFEHPIRQAAIMRWQMLAEQSMMKNPMGMMPGAAQPMGGQPPSLSPQEQPFQNTNPGIAAGTAAQMAGNDPEASRLEGLTP